MTNHAFAQHSVAVRDRLSSDRSFAPDEFQAKAFDSIDAGRSVLVAAPTGSGKTLVADYGIRLALATQTRAIYTAPIKALSNQKYRDWCLEYGESNVGLLTGDITVNPDAPIMVMTTEVLRNMIYAGNDALERLSVVVLDEVHFIQDAYRGGVWEEIIVHLAPEVVLICLSATVGNTEEIARWLSVVRGPTDIAFSAHRPVPLDAQILVHDRSQSGLRVFVIDEQGKPNSDFMRLESQQRKVARGPRHHRSSSPSRLRSPRRTEVVRFLHEHDRLPAIYFVFSRRGCEDSAIEVFESGMRLTSVGEAEQIAAIADRAVESFSDDDLAALGFVRFAELLERGIAAHHAGMVPIFKEIVERCFALGLIKIVFATETLAVGVNMPARTVVIDRLTKYDGTSHVMIKPSDYSQLTGRAGRRGIDTSGTAFVIWEPFVAFDAVHQLVTSKAFQLSSSFRPTYNMATNLIATTSEVQATHLLNLSLAQFQSARDVVHLQARLGRLEIQRKRLLGTFDGSEDLARAYIAELADRAASQKGSVRSDAFSLIRLGDVLHGEELGLREALLVIAKSERKSKVRLTLIGTRCGVVHVSSDDVSLRPRVLDHHDLPQPYAPTSDEFQRRALTLLDRKSVALQTASGNSVPLSVADDDPLYKERIRATKDLVKVDTERVKIFDQIDKSQGAIVSKFRRLQTLLGDHGYTDGWSLTSKGQVLRSIFHECDVVIAESLSRGVFDDLSAPDLCGVMSCFVFEPRGDDETVIRIGGVPGERIKLIERISASIRADEKTLGITQHRGLHRGFFDIARDWCAGATLDEVLTEDLQPGDFVRTMRQIADLLRQVGNTSVNSATKEVARGAAGSIQRGVVLASIGGVEQ